ncbi:hypothetical protein C8J57DRAFT_1254476 [Mycena rebaudengoi]|nr:hypothetical protein C8J57DRAFT_1254476 [Mycena rebaudengoi]
MVSKSANSNTPAMWTDIGIKFEVFTASVLDGCQLKACISPVEDYLHLQDSNPFVENLVIRLEPKTIARRALFSATGLRRFRHVALGNINLLYETAPSSEVCKVKVFTARISGEQSPMTVATYEDEDGAKVEIRLGIVFSDKFLDVGDDFEIHRTAEGSYGRRVEIEPHASLL